MWIESSLQIGDYPVGLSVEHLDDEERERTAAVLAWLTLETVGGGGDGASAWSDVAAEMLHRHVAFSIPGVPCPERLGQSWWNETLRHAFFQFVTHNELLPRINRHIETLQSAARVDRAAC